MGLYRKMTHFYRKDRFLEKGPVILSYSDPKSVSFGKIWVISSRNRRILILQNFDCDMNTKDISETATVRFLRRSRSARKIFKLAALIWAFHSVRSIYLHYDSIFSFVRYVRNSFSGLIALLRFLHCWYSCTIHVKWVSTLSFR